MNLYINYNRLVFPLLLLSVSFSSYSQEKHIVETSGLAFVPASITISVGDTVEWINNSGNHNVNGTIATYPNNPDSFGNSVGSNWTYSFKFTEPGTYDYVCDPHISFGMTGQVVVQDVSDTGRVSIDKVESALLIYPTLASEKILIESSGSIESIEFYSTSGKYISPSYSLLGNLAEVNVSELPKGYYTVFVTTATISQTSLFIKE